MKSEPDYGKIIHCVRLFCDKEFVRSREETEQTGKKMRKKQRKTEESDADSKLGSKLCSIKIRNRKNQSNKRVLRRNRQK